MPSGTRTVRTAGSAWNSATRAQQEQLNTLTSQLSTYHVLRAEERKLRRKVGFLAGQVAKHGSLHAPVDLVLESKDEQTMLARLRRQLLEQEVELLQLQSISSDERSDIEAQRLEQLLSDMKALREQQKIHTSNLQIIEELQAKLGLDVRLDLENELKETQAELERLRYELHSLETKLGEQWLIKSEQLKDLDLLDESGLRTFTQKFISQQSELHRTRHYAERKQQKQQEHEHVEQIASLKRAYIRRGEAIVLDVLNELEQFGFSNATISRNFRVQEYDNPSSLYFYHVKPSWYFSSQQSKHQIAISLIFENDGRARNFSCERYYRNKLKQEISYIKLSRKALIEAIKRLFSAKRWWQLWYTPPDLPKDWM